MSIISTLIAFVVALGSLIVFHELGHYLVARLCKVKVLRFSLGFGRVLWRRKFGADQTEWAISAFPLGGYVKMLDEREGPVTREELHRAFNRQTVAKRFIIVLAGPVANFLLAILLYWILFLHGVPGVRPVVGEPLPGTPAAQAQIAPGELIARVDEVPVPTWQELRWVLLDRALRKATVQLELHSERGDIRFQRLDLSSIGPDKIDTDLIQAIGLTRYQPPLKPVIGRLIAGGAGERDGLMEGDQVLEIDGRAIAGWEELVASVTAAPGRALQFNVLRAGTEQHVVVTPESKHEGGKTLGRIGAAPKIDEAALKRLMTEVHYGALESIAKAAQRTWEVSTFTLMMLGKMIIGDVSLKNLSGPITIADYAGQSAQLGWLPYLSFLALISISLGVLNLMPVPLLDGGHLMYYVAEIVKGSPVSERVMEVGQQVGMVLLFSLMAFALYNDINRLLGS
ncbi:MAG TPA: RIP metalloprotease RseP [Burkholderiales bacterium]|nr:RIP metalloprotease RseP [Burkholderiales bacterium]